MSAPYEYPPTPLSITDLLAWAGATGGGLVDYPADEELRLNWKWKFDKWQRATVAMRDMLLKGILPIPVIHPAGGGDIGPGPATIIGWDDSAQAWKLGSSSSASTNTIADVLLLTVLHEGPAQGYGYLLGEFVSALDTTGASVGDPVYLGAGVLQLTPPTTGVVQRIGYVKTLSATGHIQGRIFPGEYATKYEVSALATLGRAVAGLDGSGSYTLTVPSGVGAVVVSWFTTPGTGVLSVTQVDAVTWTIQSSAGATDAALTFTALYF